MGERGYWKVIRPFHSNQEQRGCVAYGLESGLGAAGLGSPTGFCDFCPQYWAMPLRPQRRPLHIDPQDRKVWPRAPEFSMFQSRYKRCLSIFLYKIPKEETEVPQCGQVPPLIEQLWEGLRVWGRILIHPVEVSTA